jgi:putative ABC transport system ATP-binding protein
MSGGQQQRVAVARALMASPVVVFADEPTAALDPGSAHQIVDALSYVAHEHGHAVVVISHDPMVASRGDRVFRMTSGQLELVSAPESAPESPWVEGSLGQGVPS